MSDPFWMVIDVTDAAYACDAYSHNPKENGPTRVYWIKSWAEDELLRLAKNNPGREFCLLECVGVGREIGTTGVLRIEEPNIAGESQTPR